MPGEIGPRRYAQASAGRVSPALPAFRRLGSRDAALYCPPARHGSLFGLIFGRDSLRIVRGAGLPQRKPIARFFRVLLAAHIRREASLGRFNQ